MATTTVRIPEDMYGRVRVIAGVTGATPGDILSRAFDEYFENHRDDFAHHFKLAQEMVFSGDTESVREMTRPARSRRARSAAERIGKASLSNNAEK